MNDHSYNFYKDFTRQNVLYIVSNVTLEENLSKESDKFAKMCWPDYESTSHCLYGKF